ncbi:glycoside hydrolase family protein [Pararhodobacter zhoushanensis]|uniref:Lysozyme n=1 Tax=Pararhodobacter zhoushanensis TaxID=2479545 RepID=A0ABT3H2U4_9RHOB|nr:peptidoglycan-binding protein [Pararhodobacter zhoushanensis]MCW1934104.1 peptidoglycan-binding protein [Pararhodobacter zhoushanensis]
MQTSERGIAFNERLEGVVLRAYLCPAGQWTIGAGLTKASGVVDPKPGMVITAEEASRLMGEALRTRYEPAVTRAMPGAKQYEFDGGVAFHWNTGAITRASWVPAWASGNVAAMRERLARWNKGGGKVLPGLTRRREAEFRLIAYRDYGVPVPVQTPRGLARVTLDLAPEEVTAARAALSARGYPVGSDARGIAEEAVRAFQRDHALTVDGILGRATLSTLQRSIDARGQTVVGGSIAAGGGAETATNVLPADLPLSWTGPLALLVGLGVLAYLAWRYRDILAARIHPILPRLAATLRSF